MSDHSRISISQDAYYRLDSAYGSTHSMLSVHLVQTAKRLAQDMDLSRNISYLQSLLALNDYFAIAEKSLVEFTLNMLSKKESARNIAKQRWLISGNVQCNPGPKGQYIKTPSNLTSQSGLIFIHLNVCSLLPIWLEYGLIQQLLTLLLKQADEICAR